VWIRDYLRTHPEDVRAYGELKRRLAEVHGEDRAAYTAAKDEFTDCIFERASLSARREFRRPAERIGIASELQPFGQLAPSWTR
jgi:GrpB protein